MATWINNDGLPIDFGLDEAVLGKVASYRTNGDLRFTEIVVEGAALPAFGNTVIVDDKCALPRGAIIARVEIAPNSVAFVGTGNLDIGTVDKNRTSNADTDSLFDGLVIGDLNSGALTTGVAGVLVNGAPLATAKLITWTVNTANLTAGAVTLRVFWTVPKHGDSTDSLIYTKPYGAFVPS